MLQNIHMQPLPMLNQTVDMPNNAEFQPWFTCTPCKHNCYMRTMHACMHALGASQLPIAADAR